jgi:hypothetical protein
MTAFRHINWSFPGVTELPPLTNDVDGGRAPCRVASSSYDRSFLAALPARPALTDVGALAGLTPGQIVRALIRDYSHIHRGESGTFERKSNGMTETIRYDLDPMSNTCSITAHLSAGGLTNRVFVSSDKRRVDNEVYRG